MHGRGDEVNCKRDKVLNFTLFLEVISNKNLKLKIKLILQQQFFGFVALLRIIFLGFLTLNEQELSMHSNKNLPFLGNWGPQKDAVVYKADVVM